MWKKELEEEKHRSAIHQTWDNRCDEQWLSATTKQKQRLEIKYQWSIERKVKVWKINKSRIHHKSIEIPTNKTNF